MSQDATLFDSPITAGTSRKGDRWTSEEAARQTDPGPDQRRTLAALAAAGGTGTIDNVCHYFESLGVARDRGALSRRLTDLLRGGYITDTGETVIGSRGRSVTVWRVL